MTSRSFVLLFCASLSYLTFAQDIITKRDGVDIEAEVLETTDENIKYKKFDFQDGPTYTEKTSEILIVDDKLIAKQGNDGMHAVNKETGERIWYNPDTEASPSLLTVHNDTIWFCSAGLFGIDANTGEKLIDDWNPEYGAWLFPVASHPTNGNIYTSDASYLYCLNPKYMK
jgi:outer membrane protein assembly factor BamB